MILYEIQHIRLKIPKELPVPGDPLCAGIRGIACKIAPDNGEKAVIQAAFVVQSVETDLEGIVPVTCLVVYFCDEFCVVVLFPGLLYDVFDSLARDHFHHVAAEGIYAQAAPELQHLDHFIPGGRVEVAVIQLDGVVPISV